MTSSVQRYFEIIRHYNLDSYFFYDAKKDVIMVGLVEQVVLYPPNLYVPDKTLKKEVVPLE